MFTLNNNIFPLRPSETFGDEEVEVSGHATLRNVTSIAEVERPLILYPQTFQFNK